MTTSTTVITGETRKIYRPSPSWRQGSITGGVFLFAVMLLIPALAALGQYRQSGQVAGDWLALVLVVALVLAAALWRARYREPDTYLALSPAGIEYSTPGLIIKTSWDNVKELRMGYAPALVLQQRAATYISIFYRRSWTTGKQIPLDIFDYDPHSALAADLRAFAPHLFIHAHNH